MTVEALEIADESKDARLRVDTRLKLASRYHRELYGEERQVTIGASSGLTALLQSISEKHNRQIRDAQVVEGEVLQVEAALEGPK